MLLPSCIAEIRVRWVFVVYPSAWTWISHGVLFLGARTSVSPFISAWSLFIKHDMMSQGHHKLVQEPVNILWSRYLDVSIKVGGERRKQSKADLSAGFY